MTTRHLSLTLLVALTLTACESLSMHEREEFDAITYAGLEIPEEKDTTTAALLNLLPGVGNFYLGQTGAGIGNLLLWPLSVVWAVPQASLDAEVINQRRATETYFHTIAGKERVRLAYEDAGQEAPVGL